MNIIVIVSDTFRRDHLGHYGNTEIRTPHLDKFAKNCITFDRYYANSFPTVPARADLFTGKYTYTYLGWGPLDQNETTLAQLLAENGYSTTAVVDTPFLNKEAYNYDRGFQDFIYIRGQDWRGEQRDVEPYRVRETDYAAPATLYTAEQWLQRHYKEKFFLYVDTWDPHEPWNPPAWYVERYYPGYTGRIVNPCYGKYRERGVSEEDLNLAHACYCGEVTMVDRWVGRLLDTVEALNLYDNTAVVFTSDHGFYFGEHGYFGKGVMDKGQAKSEAWVKPTDVRFYRSPLYDEVSHVPLIVHVPGHKARRTNAIASLADLMPTVLDLAGVEIPKTIHSRSLSHVIEGDEVGKDFTVTSWPLYNPGEVTKVVDALERGVQENLTSSIITRDWLLVYGAQGEVSELYRLSSDPKQEKNVIEDNPEMAREIHSKFVSTLSETGTESRLIHPRLSL